jgi:DNA-directed RNA polymerase subunit RPC12/RpoP
MLCFPCRKCGQMLSALETDIGQTVPCPNCGRRVCVPCRSLLGRSVTWRLAMYVLVAVLAYLLLVRTLRVAAAPIPAIQPEWTSQDDDYY